ncbi:MAG: cobalamin-independent methionine synthase II family protein [Chloroflexi bacterium]|nr:MAG: cobalamin-independent methionine synthase II family protein [Chloroflexota bacterium]
MATSPPRALTLNAVRADHVGSLLRPAPLLQARIDHTAGRLDLAGLRAEEDRAILDALRRQRDCGIDVCSDGEFRRASFLTGVSDVVDGFVPGELPPLPWRGGDGNGESAPPVRGAVVAARLRPREPIAGAEAAFLREHCPTPFKVTLPSPLLFAMNAYEPGRSDRAYPAREDLLSEVSGLLAEAAGRLAREGVPYVQLDSPSYTHLVDPEVLAARRALGVDVRGMLDEAIAGDNRVLDAARAGGALTAVHLCRGNLMGRWLSRGGYDAIAERLFTALRCDRLLLEYDSSRAGTFAPLRFVPAGKVVALGLITTKSGQLESADDVLRRIDEASRIVPLERLAVSPQCGFATSVAGNPLTQDDQWRKLELVATLAREVWP